ALMTVIDAHQHFWVLAAHDQPFLRSHPSLAPLLRDFTVGELAPQAAAAGVTGTVVVQTILEPGETPELLELAAAGGLVAGVSGRGRRAARPPGGGPPVRSPAPAAGRAGPGLADPARGPARPGRARQGRPDLRHRGPARAPGSRGTGRGGDRRTRVRARPSG